MYGYRVRGTYAYRYRERGTYAQVPRTRYLCIGAAFAVPIRTGAANAALMYSHPRARHLCLGTASAVPAGVTANAGAGSASAAPFYWLQRDIYQLPPASVAPTHVYLTYHKHHGPRTRHLPIVTRERGSFLRASTHTRNM